MTWNLNFLVLFLLLVGCCHCSKLEVCGLPEADEGLTPTCPVTAVPCPNLSPDSPRMYELGAALFIGWAGASLCIIGGVIFCFSISDNNKTPRMGYTYNGPTSVMSSRTKYHGGEGDFKPTSPSKQFDKNAYV